MNKSDLIERMQEYLEKLQDVQSDGFCIAEDIDNTGDAWKGIDEKLREIDAIVDDACIALEELMQDVENMKDWLYTTNYLKAVSHISNRIMCNHIHDIDPNLGESAMCCSTDYDYEHLEPMQYFLTDAGDDDVEWLCENYDRMLFMYSDVLRLWILIVDHFGTAWDNVYIGTNNEYDATE